MGFMMTNRMISDSTQEICHGWKRHQTRMRDGFSIYSHVAYHKEYEDHAGFTYKLIMTSIAGQTMS